MTKKRRKYPVAMYAGTRIREITDRDCWQVDYTALGERDRKRFPTLAKAKTWIDQKDAETKNKGLAAFGLEDRDRLDISEARKWLGEERLRTVALRSGKDADAHVAAFVCVVWEGFWGGGGWWAGREGKR